MDHPERYLGPFAAFATSVTWAFASARYAEASHLAGGVRVNLVRALFASTLWLSVSLVSAGPHALAAVDARAALLLVASITCSYVVGDNLFFAAARRLGVSSALAVATIYPVWAALYGTLFHAEPFGARRALGLAFCVGGIVALLRQGQRPGEKRAQARHAVPWGVALALITSIFWAGNAVCLKLGAQGLGVAEANALRFSIGMLLLLVQVPFQRVSATAASPSLPRLARALALPLLVDAGLGSIFYTYGIANTDMALGATLSSLSPLAALALAAASGTERVTLFKVLAIVTIMAGVTLLILPT